MQALTFFHTDELEAEVIKVADAARAKGITGVPITVIDGKWAVSGGQSSDVFVQVCDRFCCTSRVLNVLPDFQKVSCYWCRLLTLPSAGVSSTYPDLCLNHWSRVHWNPAHDPYHVFFYPDSFLFIPCLPYVVY